MDEVSGQLRSWNNLPNEILSSIADRLGIIEILSFRGTCKDFRSASSTASAEIESTKTPWLLFHKTDSSECLIYNKEESKTYKRNIPDLEGAICLASYQGWLLVFKNESIFFFSPFSLAKITLPNLPYKQIENHVAAFSHPPTSPHCLISIINPIENSSSFVVDVISKGQSVWTRYKIPDYSIMGKTLTATYDHKSGRFYYMDDVKNILTFSVKDKNYGKYYILDQNDPREKPTGTLPYNYSRTEFSDMLEKKRHELQVEDDEYINVCGLTYGPQNSSHPLVILNEVVKDVSPTKTRMRRAVWVQPRFFESAPDHQW